MPADNDGCVAPAGGPVAEQPTAAQTPAAPVAAPAVMAKVGHKAPDFEASAFVGDGFKNIKLSDYLGQWVVLCFYPGDFTFV